MATVGPVEVLLLGTGGPRGWPEPGCACASCSTAVRSRSVRAPTCALVDDVLLLGGFDGVARAAARAGRDLARVRQVLVTAASPDPRRWLDEVGGSSPVEVRGPAAALEGLDAERVRPVPVSPGQEHPAPGGHHVRAVQQGDALAWDVRGAAGRLLHAPGRGQLGGSPAQPPYDLVQLGLDSAAQVLAQLRRDGTAGPATQVRAVGYDHDAARPDVLQHHLEGWGVRGSEDGDVVLLGDAGPEPSVSSTRTLVLGGVRSGKSALAEQLLAAHPHVTYVATGGTRSDDAEWQQRVEAHRARRPASWRTVETTDLVACVRDAEGAVLVDCLGTWLTALLDQNGVWHGGPLEPVEAAVDELLVAWRATRVPLVVVSNEVGSGVVPATPSGRLFRDLLGRLNARVAAESDTVLLTVAGIPLPLRVPARS